MVVEESWGDVFSFPKRSIRVYLYKIFGRLNKYLLKTYPLIEDCARCRDCGRNVHDFSVPDDLWLQVIGSPNGVWCYDCFCNRADEKLGRKWRVDLVEKWNNSS